MKNSFKFVHAADLHLDSPLLGLEAFSDAPVDVIRDATRVALKRIVELCLNERVDFLLIAGDVYDGDWKSLATGRFFAEQMVRLTKAGIQVFLIKGNHDAASLISREVILPGVFTFDHLKPQTKFVNGCAVAIHGQSFAHRVVSEDLSAKYPDPVPGMFNIGMLHTCAAGDKAHEPYAPCSVDSLVRKGYDYWALGHVHQRVILNESPPVVFPGNIQGRHVRETADDGKGVTLVEVRDGRATMTHVAVDSVRWMHLTVDVAGVQSTSDVILRVAAASRKARDTCDGRLLAARVTITGRCEASLAIHKDLAAFDASVRTYIQGSVDDVWIEEIRIETHSDSTDAALVGQGSLGDLLAFIRTADETGRLSEVRDKLGALRERIRSSAPELVAELDLDDDNLIDALLPDVEEAVLAMAVGLAR